MTRAKGKGQRAKVRNLLVRDGLQPAAATAGPKALRLRISILALCLVPVTGCRQDMHDAPRYDPLEASEVLAKQSSAQPLVAGTVARGHEDLDTHLTTGKIGNVPVDAFPFAITRADLDRGEERFNIYCAPCHGRTGEGNGMVVQRGYKQAANYHIARLRAMPVGYFFDVMSNGFGAMPDYRAQISVEDRWRIVAYVRALQLSHHATTADVPADELRRISEGGAAAPAAGATPPTGRGGHEE
jgi:mono/diheme cytochrome c family protein